MVWHMTFDEFRSRLLAEGLGARECNSCHWQVMEGATPLVNVWPTTGKALSCSAKPGVKGKVADFTEVLLMSGNSSGRPATTERSGSSSLVESLEALRKAVVNVFDCFIAEITRGGF